jgi:hypothetical protein
VIDRLLKIEETCQSMCIAQVDLHGGEYNMGEKKNSGEEIWDMGRTSVAMSWVLSGCLADPS